MIRVVKPAAPPVLLKKGKEAAQELCRGYDAGLKEFEFNSSIYAAKTVKDALCKAQHGKCAFCESMVTAIAYGDHGPRV